MEKKVENRGRLARGFRDLEVYQRASRAAMRIFELSRKWPREELYSLTDQIRKSSRSVCGNIAEAWRKRRYPAHFVSKLSDADAESAETENWLDFARDCGYLQEKDHAALTDEYDHICRMLTKMMNDPDAWCRPSRERVGA